jgi:pimeloyl-ACP methyl ester carboxylesterase
MARVAGESPRTARYFKLSPPGTLDPVILCCEISGEGPWVVLVPGLGDTVWVWRCLMPFLETGHRVAAVELRGHGRSASPAGPYTLEGLAGDLGGLTAALGARRPILIGQGLGGRAALLLALERPELPAALVLIATDPAPPQGAAREALLAQRAHAARGDMQATYKVRKAAGALPRGMTPRERAEHHRLFLRNAPRGYAAALEAELGGPDLTGRLAGLRCPVLAVGGEREASGPEAARRLARAVPGGETVVVEGAGSFVQLDRPEALQALLEGFFRKHRLSVPHADTHPSYS